MAVTTQAAAGIPYGQMVTLTSVLSDTKRAASDMNATTRALLRKCTRMGVLKFCVTR